MSLDYFELNIGQIYASNLKSVRNGQITDPILEKFIELLQSEIIESGELFTVHNDLINGDKNAKEYYILNRKKYHDAETTNDQILLGYFFTPKGGYEFYQNIPISLSNSEIAFWFAFKLFTYEEDLTKVDLFLNHQYQLRNNDSSFLRFVKSISRQYQTTLYSVALVSTINEWVLYNENRPLNKSLRTVKPLVKKETTPKIKSVNYSYKLKTLTENPLLFENNHRYLLDVYQELFSHKFLENNQQYESFEKIFSNNKISKSNRLKWFGTNAELNWFVNIILKELEIIEPVGNELWFIATKCFVKLDGLDFEVGQLRQATSKKIGRKELLYSILEKIQ